ncbi:MAG TPA: CBS domain-containing protein [Thermoproteales archaeon]|nr:CBS domain-containing protein [Thermoproteales archaeon]
MKVWEFLEKSRAILYPDDPLTKARELFRETNSKTLPVIDYNYKYLGYLKEQDVLAVTSSRTLLKVKDFIREYPLITADEDLEEAVEKMIEEKLIEIPVVKSLEDKTLVGILSLRRVLQALRSLGFRPKVKSVGEVMSEEVHSVTLDTPVNKVWSKIVFRNASAVVVLGKEGDPVGIVTPRDLVESGRWYFKRESEKGAKPAKVSKIMMRGVMVATEDTPISTAIDAILEYGFDTLPVIDEKGRLKGILTIFDLVWAFIKGRKPGRPVIKPVVKPIPVTEEEKPVYVTRSEALMSVLVRKQVSKEAREKTRAITASEIALKEMPAIRDTDTLEHAINEFLSRKVKHLLVLDKNGNIIGVLSTRNILRAISIKGPYWKRKSPTKSFIFEIMDTNIPRVREDTSLEDVAMTMFINEIDVVFVENDAGEIVGFITKEEILDAYSRLGEEELTIENVIMPRETSIVHPFHSLAHVVRKMIAYYRDALVVAEGTRIFGVISESSIPFIAFEDSTYGPRTKKVIWVRKRGKAGEKSGGYVKILPLTAIDANTPLPEEAKVTVKDPLLKAIKLMRKYDVDGIPVINEEGKIVGVVCKNDIIRELARRTKVRLAIEREIVSTEKA